MQGVTKMRKHISLLFLFCFLSVAPATAQTVLFDGLVLADRQAAALLIPAVVTSDDYSLLGRLEYGIADRANFFALVGGRLNGGGTGLAGAGWAATFYRQTDALPLNFGFFNSYVFPLESGGPDAFVTVAPVFSHSWERDGGGRVTPYAGASVTFLVNKPGRGDTNNVNGLLGVKVTEVAERWDFIAEVQPGEETSFAFGFFFRF